MLTHTGAWSWGTYRQGMRGTLGHDLTSDSDQLGWALVAWKHELAYNGYLGAMQPDQPLLGDAFNTQLRRFQHDHGLTVDGLLGPASGERILRSRIWQTETSHHLPEGILWLVTAQESMFDLGAVGSADNHDRGAQQRHIYVTNSVQSPPLDQAILPIWSVPAAGGLLAQVLASTGDMECAVAAWNVGTGGAAWWCSAGKPAVGGPVWFPNLAERASEYVRLVFSRKSPTAPA